MLFLHNLQPLPLPLTFELALIMSVSHSLYTEPRIRLKVTRQFKANIFHLINDTSTVGFHSPEMQAQSNVFTVSPSFLPVTQSLHSTYLHLDFQNQS